MLVSKGLPVTGTKWVVGACFSAFIVLFCLLIMGARNPLNSIPSVSWLFENMFYTIRYFWADLLRFVNVFEICFSRHGEAMLLCT